MNDFQPGTVTVEAPPFLFEFRPRILLGVGNSPNSHRESSHHHVLMEAQCTGNISPGTERLLFPVIVRIEDTVNEAATAFVPYP